MADTVNDKLQYLEQTKQLIKQAIISKGVDVSDQDTFRSYANKIETIKQGSGTIVNELDPTKLAGLVFWIDGRCNTRLGVNKELNYMEDLVLPVQNVVTKDLGYAEYLPNKNTWNNNMMKLGTFSHYPMVVGDELTVEAIFSIDDEFTASVNVMSTAYTSGWALNINSSKKVRLQVRQKETDDYVMVYSTKPLETNKLYYVVGQFKNNETVSINIINIDDKAEVPFQTCKNEVFVAMAMGSSASKSMTTDNEESYAGVSVGMVRIWQRKLSEEEIMNNYNNTFKYFESV